MVYINETGKVNQVWLDKPYGTSTPVCPDCQDSGDTWNSGYTSGYTDGYDSGVTDGHESGYTDGWQPGYNSGYTDGLQDCSGGTINNQSKSNTFYKKDVELIKAGWNNYTYRLKDNIPYVFTYDSGYTGLENAEVILSIEASEAITEGRRYQLTFLSATTITDNGTYTRDNGWSSVTVNVPQTGYTQADLDAAFQSGITYQKGLLTSTGITQNGHYTSQNGFSSVTVSVDCQYGGYNILDFTYITTGDNETINLFMGEEQNDNQYFFAFYSAITYMEIDGVPTLKDPNNIQLSHPCLYSHTFASAGNHTVRFMMARSFSAATQAGTKYPAFELTDLIFCSNSQDKCPIVTANIGEGYEVLGIGVFQGNTTLTAATIPASVTGITWVTFENSAIKQLTCYGTTPPVLGSSNVFSGVNSLEHIYVPASAVDTYKAANGWSNFAGIIEAIQ